VRSAVEITPSRYFFFLQKALQGSSDRLNTQTPAARFRQVPFNRKFVRAYHQQVSLVHSQARVHWRKQVRLRETTTQTQRDSV